MIRSGCKPNGMRIQDIGEFWYLSLKPRQMRDHGHWGKGTAVTAPRYPLGKTGGFLKSGPRKLL